MVFVKLKKINLIMSENKAFFCLKQVKLLGKIVNGEGVTTDPTLTIDMLNFPEPRNPKQALSFLGLCGVYQNFIADYMQIDDPLFKYASGKAPKWTDEHKNAFKSLKKAMSSSPVLRHPDFKKDFVIFSDASQIGGEQCLHKRISGR